MDWLDKALCKNLHTDLFYPPLDDKTPNDYYSVAKTICYNCSVWKPCLDEATKHADRWGCWGGLTPQERKSPKKVAHGTKERYRTGCSCVPCTEEHNKASPTIDTQKVPKIGQHFDISELTLKLHRYGD